MDEDASRLLTENGFEIGDPVMIPGGPLLCRVNNVLMFEWDAEDLAFGRATLNQILERNKGKVLPDGSPLL